MTEKRKLRAGTLGAIALALGGLAPAASADVAICAAEQAISCSPYEPCSRSLPGAVSLPILMKIDSEASEIVGVGVSGDARSSAITSFVETDASQLIHGADTDRAWVMQIDKATGRFTGTVAGSGVGFVVFGECSWEVME